MSTEQPPVWFVRLKLVPGMIGLTKRTTHVVAIPAVPGFPETLTAYCGLEIGRGEAEIVAALTGQPCDTCLLLRLATLPEPPSQLAIGD